MKEIILIFPDTFKLAAFIQNNVIHRGEVETEYCILSADLSDNEIKEAINLYGAVVYHKLNNNFDEEKNPSCRTGFVGFRGGN